MLKETKLIDFFSFFFTEIDEEPLEKALRQVVYFGDFRQ